MIQGVYLVLDPAQTGGREPAEVAAAALEGGARAVQWRQKIGSLRALWPDLMAVQRHCREAGAALLINDGIDLALALGADGAHLGQDDLPPRLARSLLPGRLLGVSITHPAQIAEAESASADYLGVGPVFTTGSKADAAPPLGLEGLRQVRRMTDLTIVAIGGITLGNAAEVRAAGADALAVISAICLAPDIRAATRALAKVMEGAPAR